MATDWENLENLAYSRDARRTGNPVAFISAETPQSNGVGKLAIKQIMATVSSQLLKAGRGEQYWSYAEMDAASKLDGVPHEYLGGETPHERLTGKSFSYTRLREWGSDCYVDQRVA